MNMTNTKSLLLGFSHLQFCSFVFRINKSAGGLDFQLAEAVLQNASHLI